MTPRAPSHRVFSWLDHLLYALSWAAFLSVLIMGTLLHPDPSGLGTHTQLHLPACGFYVLFHKPCPSCGMTTAFALLLHGHPVLAFTTQPAAVAVFLAGLCTWLYLPIAWRKRKPFDHLFELKAFLPVVLTLIVIILGVWIGRLLS